MVTLTIRLGGLMSRRWRDDSAGKKLRKQTQRRAQRMSDANGGASVEILDENGILLDYCTGPVEYRELLRGG